jgi:hypothetical protein
MPYIRQERRASIFRYDPFTDQHIVQTAGIKNAGELNFAITKLIWTYFQNHRDYQGHNDIVGALDNAKDEWKRRIQNNYEDLKCAENGDVYD